MGNAIAKSGIPRDEIFLTTKVWIEHYGYERAKASVLESMRKLQVDYLDLCLLHQPFSDAYGAYRALEELYDEGKIRAIGISNFYTDRMVDFASFNRIKPMVNQVELHPFFQQENALSVMKEYGVVPEAWGPFAEGNHGIFTHPVLAAIGEKYGKTPAQVALRWNVQRGVVVIPKSVHKERMEQNIDVWDFEDETETDKRNKGLQEATSNVYGNGHTSLFADMIDAIKNDRKPYVDAYAGRNALEMILAIYKSQKTGMPVKLPLNDFASTDMIGTFK